MTGSVPSFPLRTKLSNPENGGRHRSVCIYERIGIATPAADDGDELLSSVTDARPLLNYVGHCVCGRPSRRRRFPAVLFPVLSPVDTKSMMRTYIRASRRTLSTASDQTSQLACTYVSNPHYTRLRSEGRPPEWQRAALAEIRCTKTLRCSLYTIVGNAYNTFNSVIC